jgi:tricarballylate dehydrogenase
VGAEFGRCVAYRLGAVCGQVRDVTGQNIEGLYCAGEMVGGLFYFSYPSGTGLVSGAVFGRLAGDNAGLAAMT